ncbi:hypothetical protein BRE01_65850 [Brevibacillus reuszeri]|uniref:Uncharacterized protein n=2 Tax=Brevibacillus reuszeri TaxID=54915 RepID=A0A0K9YUG3_9BACL|nr:hypothetical protein [Brevibacillus reuszeri]KNB72302.1 hypothetical protein ADS79_10425 [Brevibacillus reuszeri]MED1861052.1 hypothetical protein [Brevibacillus reuszeri]GED72883.1 hypothetical protein BRE01_65850 [Brevibacillus reuszeri]
MGNYIDLYDGLESEGIHMSNAMTSVIISVLVLAGSRLAVTERQKELIVWLAYQDQSIRGIGTVGFSFNEIPWSKESFPAEKQFLASVIREAVSEAGWLTLDYQPNKARVATLLEKLDDMLKRFEITYVDEQNYAEWKEIFQESFPEGFQLCPRHDALMSEWGCVVCHDS